MSEYFFGVGTGKVPDVICKRLDKIATKHGATFTMVNMPGEGWRYWFACPNRGAPFDGAVAKAVLDEVEAAEIELPGRPWSGGAMGNLKGVMKIDFPDDKEKP
jgi:hypothetical protein